MSPEPGSDEARHQWMLDVHQSHAAAVAAAATAPYLHLSQHAPHVPTAVSTAGPVGIGPGSAGVTTGQVHPGGSSTGQVPPGGVLGTPPGLNGPDLLKPNGQLSSASGLSPESIKNEVKMEPLDYSTAAHAQAAAAQAAAAHAHAAQEQYQQWMAHYGASMAVSGSMGVYPGQPYHQQLEVNQHHAIGFA